MLLEVFEIGFEGRRIRLAEPAIAAHTLLEYMWLYRRFGERWEAHPLIEQRSVYHFPLGGVHQKDCLLEFLTGPGIILEDAALGTTLHIHHRTAPELRIRNRPLESVLVLLEVGGWRKRLDCVNV